MELLNSERKDLLEKIKQERNRADEIYNVALRRVNAIILNDKTLTLEQKTSILEEVWKK